MILYVLFLIVLAVIIPVDVLKWIIILIKYMYRELVPIVNEHNAGHVIGFIIGNMILMLGLLYMYAFVYFIYKKYLANLFEDFMSLLDVSIRYMS